MEAVKEKTITFQTSATPAKSKFIVALGYSGNIISLTQELKVIDKIKSMNLYSILAEILLSALDYFKYLNKLHYRHNLSKSLFRKEAKEILLLSSKYKTGYSEETINAIINLFLYRSRIRSQMIDNKTSANKLPKEEFMRLLNKLNNSILFSKKYLFLPYQYDQVHTDSSDSFYIHLLTKWNYDNQDINLTINIDDPFYNIMLNEYAMHPEKVLLYNDVITHKPMITCVYYTNEPGFITLNEVNEKYYKPKLVDNMNIFWYIKNKSVGL